MAPSSPRVQHDSRGVLFCLSRYEEAFQDLPYFFDRRESGPGFSLHSSTGRASEGAYKLDFAPLGNKPDQHGFERVFKEALGEYRPIILEVVIASVVMSVIALGASVFSMQVYDRVIPTHGVATLIVLAIGVSLAIVFELGMKFARSHIMDSVVSGLDAKLSQALFERLLSVRVDQLPGSVGSLAGQLRGYEQIRSFYTSQTLFTLVDLPLGLLFVLVIAFIASPWMALVPTVFGLAAIGIGYLSNRKVVRLADKSAAASNLKTGLLVETVEGVETIKSGSGGWKFLSRWIDVSAESIRSDMATRRNGEQDSYYDPAPNVDATFQLRATGSALGYVAAGAKISLNMAQIALESVPPGGTFNGMADSGASTLRIALALPYKISWSGNAPKLIVKLAGRNFEADCETSGNTNGGDVLHFILRLGAEGDASKPSTKGLDGEISIPVNALKFHADSYVYTDGGNVLFTPDGAGNWSDRDGHAVPGNNIAAAIGVDTQLNTTYKVDTTPPADPKLEMVERPVFVNGFRPALDASGAGVPMPEKLNAIVSSNPDDGFSVWTSKITQKFSVVTGQPFDKVNDKGAIVRLMVSFTGTGGPGENFAEAILAEERLDEKGEATFTESSYKAEVVASLNRFAQKANFGDGVPLKLSAYVLDKAGNKSQQQNLTFSGNSDTAKFVLDVQAPSAPTNVQLDTGSDTGRDTGSTTTDNITALSHPVVIVTGGTIGSVISLWSDAGHTQLLGRGTAADAQ